MKYIDKQIIYVNSRNRTSGTTSNFSYNIQLKSGNKFNRVVLLQATISKTYYLIQSPYNYFTVTETAGGVPLTFNVNLTEGNDYIQALAADIATKCTAASLASGYGWTYTVTVVNQFNTVDPGKLTYNVAQGSSLSAIQAVSFIFPSLTQSTVYEPMGFDADSTNDFTVSLGAGTLQSSNVVYLQAQDVIFVRSDICSSYAGIAGASGSVLQEITVNSGSAAYSNINFEQYSPEFNSRDFRPASNGNFQFILTDENGLEINMNGGVVQLLIAIYQSNETDKIVNLFTKTMSLFLDEMYPKITKLVDWGVNMIDDREEQARDLNK